MQRFTTYVFTTAAVLLLWTRPPLAAQAAGAGTGAVIGTGTFTAFVENMDRSLGFFHDAFDMEVPPLPAGGERPYNNPNPRLFAMFDIPGARERHQSARVPAAKVNVELMEIQNVEFRTVPLRIQDPGSATLVLLVRDVDAALARARQAGARVASPGGQPVSVADGRAVLIRDVDARFIELRQPALLPDAAAAVTDNVVDMRLSIAVDDLERTTRVYRDVLGFKVEAPDGADKNDKNDNATRALTGLSKAHARRSRVQAPGSTLWIEFVEYKDVERTPLHMRIQDRGAARLQLRAQNVDALVATMKAAGMTVVSDGGVAVPIPPNLKGALVADPNNFFLTPFAPCDGCAPNRPAPAVSP
jgi:catechol 2,3-dioxygenase-like lactoylglutathione lyase family enzyme